MKKLVLVAVLLTAISNIDAATSGFDWRSYVPSRESIATGAQNFGTRCYQWASNSPWKATAVGLGGMGLGLYGYWYTRPAQELRRWLSSSLRIASNIPDADFTARVDGFTHDTPGMSQQLLDDMIAQYRPLIEADQSEHRFYGSFAPSVFQKIRERLEQLRSKRNTLYPSEPVAAFASYNKIAIN